MSENSSTITIHFLENRGVSLLALLLPSSVQTLSPACQIQLEPSSSYNRIWWILPWLTVELDAVEDLKDCVDVGIYVVSLLRGVSQNEHYISIIHTGIWKLCPVSDFARQAGSLTFIA